MITLLTDFGLQDTFVGQMRMTIARIAPNVPVIDLSHAITPQDVLGGAVALLDALPVADASMIHIAVVDPGVGSTRRAVAVETSAGILIGPDNGLLSLAVEKYRGSRAIVLDNTAYHRQPTSTTFHGRDIFACAAAFLATGSGLEQLGSVISLSSLIGLQLPSITRTPQGLAGCILTHDHFGNILTNITHEDLMACKSLATARTPCASVVVFLPEAGIKVPCHQAYADVECNAPVAYIGSSGRLELAIRNGNAASAWQVHRMDPVTVHVAP